MCSLVQLIDNKTVRIHEFPTLKFSIKFREYVQELAKKLKIQNVTYPFISEKSPCILKKRR